MLLKQGDRHILAIHFKSHLQSIAQLKPDSCFFVEKHQQDIQGGCDR